MAPCCPCWSYLTTRLCFWSESPLAPSSSSSDAPVVLILILGTNTKYAHIKYLRVLETFLGIWTEEEGFPVQYPEHIALIPVHILTLKTVSTVSAKWSFWSHSVLTALSISSPNSYLFTLFLSFISESPVFPVELSLQLAFSFLNKNDCCWAGRKTFCPPRWALWGSSFDYEY